MTELRRQIHAEMLKKTSLRRRPPPKIEASCFCFLRSGDSDEISLRGGEEQRPPPYNPGFNF